MNIITQNKRELFYCIVLFVMMEFSLIIADFGVPHYYYWMSLLILFTVFIWSIFTYLTYGNRKISKYSKVLLKIDLRERFFPYIVIPTVFVASLQLFLYLNKSQYLRQLILVAAIVYLFLLLMHIKNSYSKAYSVTKFTKVIFNFVDIFIFYLVVSSIFFMPLYPDQKVILSIATAAILLMHQLRIHKQQTITAYVIWAISTVIIAMVLWLTMFLSFYIIPILVTIAFYAVVSIWNTRLAGHVKFSEYLIAILFALMALIVVLSF
jgi:hypothetical protein